VSHDNKDVFRNVSAAVCLSIASETILELYAQQKKASYLTITGLLSLATGRM